MLNEAVIELQQRVGSRREIMERLGKKNIPKLLDEIEQDTKERVDMEKQIKGGDNFGNTDPNIINNQ